MTFEYKRIRDIKEFTFDSLENLCNIEAADGWTVIDITNGDTYRTATLEREIKNETRSTDKDDSNGNGLSIISPAAATGHAVVKRRTRDNQASTKG